MNRRLASLLASLGTLDLSIVTRADRDAAARILGYRRSIAADSWVFAWVGDDSQPAPSWALAVVAIGHAEGRTGRTS